MMRSLFFIIGYYYRLVGKRLFILGGLMLLAIVFESIGVGLALPMLQGMEEDNSLNNILRAAFDIINCEYSLKNILLVLLLLVFARSLFMVLQAAYAAALSTEIQISLRKQLIGQIFKMRYQEQMKYPSAYLNNAVIRELESVVGNFLKLAKLSISGIMVIAYIGLAFFVKPQLVMILGLVGIPFLFLIKRLIQYTKSLSLKSSSLYGEMQHLIIQALHNFKYLKATSGSPKVLEHIYEKNEDVGKIKFKQAILNAISTSGFDPFIMVFVCGVIFYFVEYKGENIIDHFFILFLLMRAMKGALGLQGELRKVMASWGSLKVVDELQENLHDAKELSNKSGDDFVGGDLELKDVTFSYVDSAEKTLDNISLHIAQNSTVAFVGSSGSGKSTLVNLLIGLLKPNSGTISVAERGYEDLDIETLRQKVGYITQESVIFHDTLLNNITLWEYSDKEIALEKVVESCKKAHIHGFIDSQPEKYEAVLGESGVNISGGQRQRISIARELYKETEILVFDEATSALDSATEKEIQKNIDELRGEKTIILIAHRLSTVKNADKIFVMDNGRIMESGSYESLLKQDGLFKEMIALQR